ncbi:adenylyl-sulfate kinase [Actinomycetospora termitidis]|uniref:Adenylyl-sulfate kinase n=1 Tax=Actinomycetospora termitidis TaxID=3053470 RepID=A0ABT7MHH0_9PSEU|nr:adenylyl-sulfate kinase [Actinomycetospora sp. Odt1-22]MDL5160132.1 adenylyl-sulfate kinase [Actinomycetospora sp. Odt1-22]
MSDGGVQACGGTVWLTGLPSAGKSTIADGVERVLRGRGLRVQVLDGDAVRAELCADLGFSRADRDTNVRRIGWAARLLAAHGVIVVVPVIAPFADVRQQVRARHEEDGLPFVEVHVDTPLEECTLRDVKGLYARQRAGDLRGLTGVDDPYEVPDAPELRVITVGRPVEECVREVVAGLVEHRVGHVGAPDPPTPSVSVCIPVYQGREFLARTVRSVLDQTYSDFELVIRDNGSTDGTADVVGSFADPRIRRYRSESTVPLTESFDRAVRLARGDLVKVVCADDVLHPRCLELQVAALASDPGLALVAGRVDMIDGDDRVLTSNRLLRHVAGRIGSDDLVRRVVRHGGNPIGPPASVMFRRADYEAVGGVRDREQFTLDISLWARLLARGDFLGQTESVAAFRVRPGTVTATAGRREFTVQRAFTTALARDASWSRHPGDLAVSLVGARTARARRQMLFAAAAVLSRLGHHRRPEGAARS